MNFPGFLGNEDLRAQLSAAVDRQREAHFYLLSGPAGSGKRTLARILSAALLCENRGNRPCMQCSHCRKVFHGTHPDLITVDDPDKKTVPVALVREAREDLFVRPNEAERKIYYVPRAQDLGLPGQNALLKVLEEPPSYGVFLLLCDNADRLLPTVRSRCIEWRLKPLSQPVLLDALQKEFPDRDMETLHAAAVRSGGFLGQAKELLSQGENWLPQTMSFIISYGKKDRLGLLEAITALERLKRDQLLPILEQWQELLSSALTCRYGLPPVDPLSRRLAQVRTPGELEQAISDLSSAMELLKGNISVGAICGDLFWKLS